VALLVDAVRVTGSASDDETVGPTLVSTFSESSSRPYVDALLEINPLDGTCSIRIVVFVQSTRVVFDAVSGGHSPVTLLSDIVTYSELEEASTHSA